MRKIDLKTYIHESTNMKNIGVIFLLTMLISCHKFQQEKADVLIDNFPKNVTLDPVELEVPTILLNPIRMKQPKIS